MTDSHKSGLLLPITLTVTLGGFLFGYDTAVISGTVGSLKVFFVDPFNLGETRPMPSGFVASMPCWAVFWAVFRRLGQQTPWASQRVSVVGVHVLDLRLGLSDARVADDGPRER